MLAVGAAALAAGTWLAPRTTPTAGIMVVLVGAVLFRALLVPIGPALSTDPYRYQWDGRVQAAGHNPYEHAPDAEELAELRDEQVWEPINRKSARTIYPPVAQYAFRGAHAAGLADPIGWKGLTAAADLAAVGLLAAALRRGGRDPRRAVAYAWNPLPVMAFALTGHLDSLVALAVAGTVLAWWAGRRWLVGALLGVAAGIKLFPLMLAPAFARARDGAWRWGAALVVGGAAAGVLAASYLPYLDVGGDVLGFLTTGYLDEQGYTDGRRFGLAEALGVDGWLLTGAVGAVVGIAVLRSRRPAPTRAAWLLGAALALTVPFGWYAAPLIVLAVAGGAGWAWPWFSLLLYVAYVAIFHEDVLGLPFGLTDPTRVAASGGVALLALAALRWGWARRAVVWQEPERPGAPDVDGGAARPQAPSDEASPIDSPEAGERR